MFFVVGTSSVVAPASSLALLAARRGAYVFEINIEETPLAPLADGRLPLERGGGPAGDRESAREEHPVTERRPRRKPGPRTGRLAETPKKRDRERRCLERVPRHLDDEELLAIVLGTGTAGKPVLETARELLEGGRLPGPLRAERATSRAP